MVKYVPQDSYVNDRCVHMKRLEAEDVAHLIGARLAHRKAWVQSSPTKHGITDL